MKREQLISELKVVYELTFEEAVSKFRGYTTQRLEIIKKIALKGYSCDFAIQLSGIQGAELAISFL